VNSAVNARYVSENFGGEILNDFQTLKNIRRERLTQHFVSVKFKELPTVNRRQELVFHESVTSCMSSFSTSFAVVPCF